MKPKRDTKQEADKLVRDLKRATRRKFNAEEKIRIVLAGLRGEDSIAELCRRGIAFVYPGIPGLRGNGVRSCGERDTLVESSVFHRSLVKLATPFFEANEVFCLCFGDPRQDVRDKRPGDPPGLNYQATPHHSSPFQNTPTQTQLLRPPFSLKKLRSYKLFVILLGLAPTLL